MNTCTDPCFPVNPCNDPCYQPFVYDCQPAPPTNSLCGGHLPKPPRGNHTPEPASWLVFSVLVVPVVVFMLWKRRFDKRGEL